MDAVFLEEFMQCMENVTSLYGTLIVCGYFNLKVNDPKDTNAATLVDLMSAMGYVQLVEFATHNQGNTLDLVFTPCDEEGHTKDIVSCSQGSSISDHCSILFDLKVETKVAKILFLLMEQSEKTVQSHNAVSMTAQRRRLWLNFETVLVECHVFAQSIQQTR